MHRTQAEFEDNLTFKVFAFQFVNLYASIFYIAFFKGRFVGFPGNYNQIFGLRNEDCHSGGCLVELSQQLAIIMIGKQIINNVQEVVFPKIRAWWQNRKVFRFIFRLNTKYAGRWMFQAKLSRKDKQPKRWEADYKLVENNGLFEEYLEMGLYQTVLFFISKG